MMMMTVKSYWQTWTRASMGPVTYWEESALETKLSSKNDKTEERNLSLRVTAIHAIRKGIKMLIVKTKKEMQALDQRNGETKAKVKKQD